MRHALGRGLDRLLPQKAEKQKASDDGAGSVRIPISSIRPNRFQPRKSFQTEGLTELAQSIKQHGLTQPVLLSPLTPDGKYELVVGERRLRAAQLAGLTHIEAQVRSVSEKERLVLALEENIQREDLNALEEARAYQELINKHGCSQTELSQILCKSRAAVSNTLRLLELSEEIQRAIESGKLSEGHARALLTVSHPGERAKLFRRVLEGGLSVRDTEAMARLVESGKKRTDRNGSSSGAQRADIRAVEQQLTQSLGMKVVIRARRDGKRGTLSIHFYSLSDFDKLLGKLK
ncbi:MAG: ParB/RepB/Spo0J family partition protein [Elusimicrobia bacterium]|nr:ParB/RepB/Spo0J family partition protein [Elusimicrobiota bacterium]